GDTLFRCGDRDYNFFVIKSGQIEIVDESGETPKTGRILASGQFTGDVGHWTGSPKVVSGVTTGGCEAYEVSDETLRHVLNQDPGLSDLIVHAFLARRQLMHETKDFVGLRVIGSRYSHDTFRIRDFLARNRVL